MMVTKCLTTLLILSLATGVEVTLMSTCSTTNGGATAAVVCHFTEDLSKRPIASAVYVQRYSFNGSTEPARHVIECESLENNGKLDCISNEPGYSFNGKPTKELEVVIGNMSAKQEGKYLCYIAPKNVSTSPDMRPCFLRHHVSDQQTKSQTTQTAEDSKPSSREETSNTVLFAVVGLLAFVLAVGLAGLVGLAVYCRRSSRRRRRQAQVTTLVEIRGDNEEQCLEPIGSRSDNTVESGFADLHTADEVVAAATTEDSELMKNSANDNPE